jgi:hypothetical protein
MKERRDGGTNRRVLARRNSTAQHCTARPVRAREGKTKRPRVYERSMEWVDEMRKAGCWSSVVGSTLLVFWTLGHGVQR